MSTTLLFAHPGRTSFNAALSAMERAPLFTTSNAPAFALTYLMGPIVRATLKGMGVGRCDRHHPGNAAAADGDGRRKAFLAEVERTV